VNTAPTLEYPADDNTPGDFPGLEPDVGRASDTFVFTVYYFDTDDFAGVKGNPPEYVQVYVDGNPYTMTQTDPADNDYTDGAEFQVGVTGLAVGTPHTYYFLASDGVDRARLPSPVGSEENGPVVDEPPGAPLNVVAGDVPGDNGGAVEVSWSASPDDGSGARDVVEYLIYRRESGTPDYPTTPLATVAATESSVYSYQDTTVAKGVEYYYVVTAKDGADLESEPSNEAGPASAIDNIAPGAPSGLNATDTGLGGTIALDWTLSPDDGAGVNDVVEYHIYRSTTTTFTGAPVATVAAGTDNYTDATAPNGVAVYYMVRAYDGENESADSNVAGPVTPTDGNAPQIANEDPPAGSVDAPRDTNISFSLVDPGVGVDQTTIAVTLSVNGGPAVDITADLTITGTPAQYDIVYDPPTDFDYNDAVTVGVSCADLDGNAMTDSFSFTIEPVPTYSVSGHIEDALGNPEVGVTVTVGVQSDVTNASGDYTVTGLAAGTYQVVPTKADRSFSPPWQTVTVGPDQTDVDFISAPGYDISGTVEDTGGNPIQGVTISDGVYSTTSQADGSWVLADVPAGTHTLTATLPGYSFTPASIDVTVGPDASGVLFTGEVVTYSVSGTIRTPSGERIQGVTVQAKQGATVVGTATTSDIGVYTISGLAVGAYDIVPSKTDYQFDPPQQAVNVTGDVTGIDFTGYTIYQATFGPGVRFVGLPLRPDDPDPIAVFGNDVTIARWNPLTSPPYEYPVPGVPNPLLTVGPGKGFFVDFGATGKTLNVKGELTPLTTFSLTCEAGWNMQANMYNLPLPWANLQLPNGGPIGDFGFIYDPATGYKLVTDIPGLGTATAIPVNAGVWMHSATRMTINVSPPVGPLQVQASAPAEPKLQAGDYLIRIVARAEGRVDDTSVAGVMQSSGGIQVANPPAVSPYVDVYFVGDQGPLACSVAGDSAAGARSWDFVVATDMAGATVQLSLPDLSSVPSDLAVILVDEDAGKRMYARTLSSYEFNVGDSGMRHFKLQVEPRGRGGLVISSMSASQAAAGGVVSVDFVLSQSASVNAKVMNIAGRLVRVLASNQVAPAGLNTLSWDLRSNSGSLAPAGRYLVQVEAVAEDGQRVTRLVPLTVQR